MPPQRAIFVPGHRVPESIRAVRFIPQATLGEGTLCLGQSEPLALASVVELWAGNYYGDLEGTMLASGSVTGETEFAFSEDELPVIPPERSLVAVIRNPPSRWVVEIQSVSKRDDNNRATCRFSIDNFGTARESLNDRVVKRSSALTENLAA